MFVRGIVKSETGGSADERYLSATETVAFISTNTTISDRRKDTPSAAKTHDRCLSFSNRIQLNTLLHNDYAK